MSEGVGIIIVGGVLLVLALAVFLWHRAEENLYYQSLTSRYDIREFVERKPKRPEPESLLLGAILLGAIGLIVVIIGVISLF